MAVDTLRPTTAISALLAIAASLLFAFVACTPRSLVDAHDHHQADHAASQGHDMSHAATHGTHSMAMAFSASMQVVLWTSSLQSTNAAGYFALLAGLVLFGMLHEHLAAYRGTLQQPASPHAHLHGAKEPLEGDAHR